MKFNKFCFAVTLACLTLFSSAITASAAWYTCSVDLVGSTDTSVLARLDDTAASPAFTNTWFIIGGTNSKEILATLLTASSLGKNVFVNTDQITNFSTVVGVYLINY